MRLTQPRATFVAKLRQFQTFSDKIENLLRERTSFYSKADIAIETDRMEADETVEAVLRMLNPKK